MTYLGALLSILLVMGLSKAEHADVCTAFLQLCYILQKILLHFVVCLFSSFQAANIVSLLLLEVHQHTQLSITGYQWQAFLHGHVVF